MQTLTPAEFEPKSKGCINMVSTAAAATDAVIQARLLDQRGMGVGDTRSLRRSENVYTRLCAAVPRIGWTWCNFINTERTMHSIPQCNSDKSNGFDKARTCTVSLCGYSNQSPDLGVNQVWDLCTHSRIWGQPDLGSVHSLQDLGSTRSGVCALTPGPGSYLQYRVGGTRS